MGLLTEGNPLNWDESESKCDYVRHHGIEQFINLYNKNKDRTGDDLKWGDEVIPPFWILASMNLTLISD